jgi:iron complex transport system substrate-binding protein
MYMHRTLNTDSSQVASALDVPMSRRTFGKLAGVAAAGLLVGGTSALTGCRSERGDEVFKNIRTITDDAGRELEIPTPSALSKVYFTSGLAQVFVMTLAPDLMAATCSKYDATAMKYLPSELNGLTYLGSTDNSDMDVESVAAHGVQIIFSISSVELTQANIDEADTIQEKSMIPVVLIDGSDEKISHAYEVLGDILGREDRAAELSAYCTNTLNDVKAAVAKVPESERKSLYYAEGPLGLQTEPAESQHALTFVVAGADVVAKVDTFLATGMADVSMESVIGWDPDVIVAWDEETRGGADNLIRTSDTWSVVKAVRDGRVYTMPNVPIAWVDRPMACNRFLGMHWIANMLYPTYYDVDMVEVGKEYYKLFYGVDVSDEEMLGFLGNSYPPYSA